MDTRLGSDTTVFVATDPALDHSFGGMSWTVEDEHLVMFLLDFCTKNNNRVHSAQQPWYSVPSVFLLIFTGRFCLGEFFMNCVSSEAHPATRNSSLRAQLWHETEKLLGTKIVPSEMSNRSQKL